MTIQKLFLWFALMIPLAYSPGPNNILCATLGTRYGVKQTLPFIVGMNTTVLLATFLIGFFFSAISAVSPVIMTVLKFTGAALLAFVALKLFINAKNQNGENSEYLPGYFEGVLLNALNPKAILALCIMYTQFYDPYTKKFSQIAVYTALTFALSVSAHFLWTAGGNFIRNRFSEEKTVIAQKIMISCILFLIPVLLFIL